MFIKLRLSCDEMYTVDSLLDCYIQLKAVNTSLEIQVIHTQCVK